MTAFDPARHVIIAKDRETGEHVHVPLPDLAREVRIDRVEKSTEQATLDRVTRLEMQMQQLAAHLMKLETERASDRTELLRICQALDQRISSFSIDVKQVA